MELVARAPGVSTKYFKKEKPVLAACQHQYTTEMSYQLYPSVLTDTPWAYIKDMIPP